jgi:hypothetical protein
LTSIIIIDNLSIVKRTALEARKRRSNRGTGFRASTSAVLAGVVSLGLVSCSDEARVLPAEQHESLGDGASDGVAEPGDAERPPLYIVTTTVSVGDVDQGYLVSLPSLEQGTTFDVADGIEVPDSTIASDIESGYLYVGSSADATVTRWELQDDDTLEPGPTLSLTSLGLSRAPVGNELFYSPEKAYIPDDANQQLVVWNPRAMEIVRTIPLGVDAEGGLQPSMSVTVRQDRVIVVVSWQGSFDDDWSVFGDRVRIISIDPESDTIVRSVDDSRCNYMFWGSTSSDGSAYFSPLSYYAPIRSMLGGGRGVDSCGLRIVPPDSDFDAAYEVSLSELVDGRPAGNLFIVDDDVAFIRVWQSELVTPVAPDKSNWQDVINESGFMWWRWPLGAAAASPIPDQEPGASETPALFAVDGRKFLPRIAADYSSTTLDELDPAGALVPAISGPGNIWGVVRLR